MITSEIKTAARPNELATLTQLLKVTYGVVPIVAGADKFFNLLTEWTKYLNPDFAAMLPFSASTFMAIVGIIEIVAGILVFIRTELGAYVVAAWLVCIAVTLILSGNYLDVAVRDIVMAVGAFTLARISHLKSERV
jgi:uncharacterized membrane protein YphA (DoxX/SURF4 family)